MNKNNLELFKSAINEGLSNKFDSIANSCSEEIVYSDKHMLAMRTIVYGKMGDRKTKSPKMKRIIAILVAAAILLTSCGIIFRNEIREIFEDLFVKVTYKDDGATGQVIEEVYILTYVPEGYNLKEETKTPTRIKYKFVNEVGYTISFEQNVIDSFDFIIDSEEGYSKIAEIEEYELYYRVNDKYHIYVWNNLKYSMLLKSSVKLSNEELVSVLNGVVTK